jgi:SAM-dependent methyltransferase
VLEIGAGPGRFTLTLARLGARITVTDLSPVQLELNARYVSAAGARAEGAVERRELLDVCDVSRHPDGAFDAVVALGGPLSYAFDRADEALAGLLRITRPGGPVVASVMSRAADRRAGRPDRPGSAAGSKTTQRGSFAISQLEVDVE